MNLKTDEIEKTLAGAGIHEFHETELRRFIANWMPEHNNDYQQENFLNDLNRAVVEILEKVKPIIFFETDYQLEQFREIERDHFDTDGNAYKPYISTHLCEQMFKLINQLEWQIKQNV